jgi:hypothetical protein
MREKKEYLGECILAPKGKYEITPEVKEKLSEPIERGEAKIFCTGCGLVHETMPPLHVRILKHLREVEGITSFDPQKEFFIFDGCSICDLNGFDMDKFRIEKIKR